MLRITQRILTQNGGIWRTFAVALRIYRRKGFAGIKYHYKQFKKGSQMNTNNMFADLSPDYTEQIHHYDTLTGKTHAKMQKTFLTDDFAPVALAEVCQPKNIKIMPEVLIVDHSVPKWDKDSGSFRMWQIIKLFIGLGWSITFFPNNLSGLEPYTSDLHKLGVKVIYGATTFGLFIKERSNQFDLIVLCRPGVSVDKIDSIRHFSPKSKVVYDTVDLHYVREERRSAIEHSEEARLAAERYKVIEIYLAKAADITLVVTEEERQRLLDIDPKLHVSVIPNIHPVPEQRFRDFETRSGLLFLGGYKHRPNVDCVKWFVGEIWPLIRCKIQNIEFNVVGSNLPESIERLKKVRGVCIVGWVPDVAPWFNKCRIFVSPLRYGAGMKGKIGHAMSYGIPVVTTTIGAEGIGLTDNETALIRDDPEGFAQAVIELYRSRDLWVKISRKGIAHIEANYSPGAVHSKLASVLQSLDMPASY